MWVLVIHVRNDAPLVDRFSALTYQVPMERFTDYGQMVAHQGAVIAVGNFDGVHLGHRHLIELARTQAQQLGLKSGVLTFYPHPVRVLAPHVDLQLICSLEERLDLLESLGVDLVLAQRFEPGFAALDPLSFIEDVLVSALGVKSLIVGYDFGFGARRAGNVDLLKAHGKRLGFDVHVVAAVTDEQGLVASSSRIRTLVQSGDLATANRVLGREFCLNGVVVPGEQRGRELGFPTANLDVSTELRPRTGVYAGRLDWGEGPKLAVVNIGTKPTFGTTSRQTVEAHVLDGRDHQLYGKRCSLSLVGRIRDEKTFAGAEELKAQILVDVIAARNRLA